MMQRMRLHRRQTAWKHFFEVLRDELSFYIGCLNLSDKLKSISMPVCIPTMINNSARSFEGLYNISLAVKSDKTLLEMTIRKMTKSY